MEYINTVIESCVYAYHIETCRNWILNLKDLDLRIKVRMLLLLDAKETSLLKERG